jgi:hypothetical protein
VEDLPTAVSLIAALVAVAAAIYARLQADAARRANKIALLDQRFEVFRALVRFQIQLGLHRLKVPENEVIKFSEATQIAEFIFPESILKSLRAIRDNSMQVLYFQRGESYPNLGTGQEVLLEEATAMKLVKEAIEEGFSLHSKMKNAIHVGEA